MGTVQIQVRCKRCPTLNRAIAWYWNLPRFLCLNCGASSLCFLLLLLPVISNSMNSFIMPHRFISRSKSKGTFVTMVDTLPMHTILVGFELESSWENLATGRTNSPGFFFTFFCFSRCRSIMNTQTMDVVRLVRFETLPTVLTLIFSGITMTSLNVWLDGAGRAKHFPANVAYCLSYNRRNTGTLASVQLCTCFQIQNNCSLWKHEAGELDTNFFCWRPEPCNRQDHCGFYECEHSCPNFVHAWIHTCCRQTWQSTGQGWTGTLCTRINLGLLRSKLSSSYEHASHERFRDAFLEVRLS